MGMIVQHNMNALNAYNRLNANVAGMKKASEKLSSGYRINRAGDDAAGLAISEKMRSQIKGLNQAIRNSQDGINMIQTFEGAAQETHSILQRMKELAVESANGTYDNATDRAAIQLEFDQLNDELNQIADTDFNGTIVLNGGTMADGLKAEGGEFNYKNLAAQKEAAIADLEKQIANKLATVPSDISTKEVDGVKVMGAVTDHDDTTYTDAVAKDLWEDLGLSSDVASIDLQFTATKADDGTVSYKATSGVAYDKDGKELTDVEITADALAKITATSAKKTGATGYGGFSFTGKTNAAVITNAVFDATKVEDGDMINFHITGPAAAAKAPTNVALADKYTGDDNDLSTIENSATSKVTNVGTPKVSTGLTDADMTEDVAKVLAKLDGAEWTITTIKNNNDAAPLAAKITSTAGDINTAGAVKAIDGVNVWVENDGAGNITISTLNAAGDGADKTILKIEGLKYTTGNDNDAADKTIKFTTVMDAYFYPEAGAGPDVNVTDADLTKFSVADDVAALQKEIDKIKNGDPDATTYANAYGQASSIMTYTEDITLQTGARTKDAVNFPFNYNTDGSADMGSLQSNLNLSARKGGLETENLSLANQKDANYAIDQIDKAINKTSMVRATFGAIQNRLEHKITNLTTTAENLTEAESSIRDTDMASEMMNYTKFNILQQAAQSMLAQANQQPQSILQLLG